MKLECLEELINDFEELFLHRQFLESTSMKIKTQTSFSARMKINVLKTLHKQEYNKILNSGLFWEFYPRYAGNYQQDFPHLA